MGAETTHTPGPWAVAWNGWIIPADHVRRSLGTSVYDAHDRDDFAQHIATVHSDRHGRGDADANARLIAAAPDLFEAITECLPFIDDAMDVQDLFPDRAASRACREAVQKVHAALAKVRGEQP